MSALWKLIVAIVAVPMVVICAVGVLIAAAVQTASATCPAEPDAPTAPDDPAASAAGAAVSRDVAAGRELQPGRGVVVAVVRAPARSDGATVAGATPAPVGRAARPVSLVLAGSARFSDLAAALFPDPAPVEGCATTNTGWVVPLPAGSYQLSSPYGPRWGTMHYGQDLAAPAGTPILAAHAGVVVSAECTSPFCDRPGVVSADGTPITAGCGWRVQIQHSGGVASTYCHARALAVHSGQPVVAGQLLGWVGSTGNSTGNHLHFQIHRGTPPITNDTTTDPVAFLRTVGVIL